MTTTKTANFRGRSAGVAGLTALMLAGCTATGPDYFDDGTSAQVESQPMMYTLMAGTLLDPPRPKIEYTQRAPLAVPPSTDLPPVEETTVVASSEANWPNDPDAARAAAEASQERLTPAQRTQAQVRGPGDNPTPDEIREARIAGGGLTDAPAPRPSERAELLSPDELATLRVGASASGQSAEISQAPTRKYLIEPPAEYRIPAETAEMPTVSASDNTGAPLARANVSDGPGGNPTAGQF